jgi:hypothetical protein
MAKSPKVAAAKSAAISEKIQLTGKITEAVANVKKFFPYVKVIYIKANGEYHFHPRPGFSAVNIDGTEIEETKSEPISEADPASVPAGTENLEF